MKSLVTESTERASRRGLLASVLEMECVRGHEEGETEYTSALGLCPGWEVRDRRDSKARDLGMWWSENSGFVRG